MFCGKVIENGSGPSWTGECETVTHYGRTLTSSCLIQSLCSTQMWVVSTAGRPRRQPKLKLFLHRKHVRAETFSPLTRRKVSPVSVQEAPVFVPPVECVSSVWGVSRVKSGCLIGLTKVKQVQERRKWLTLTADTSQVFEMRILLNRIFTDLPLTLFITLRWNFGASVTVLRFV